ncbi:hypothetical protein BDZ89DRAFT_1073059 [Hymenopellis radicata]|nr:hypothetical protein BDZ89DRAFT_1073059 [Hymenopellis radicata]
MPHNINSTGAQLLDLIIQNLKDAQSLRCLGLASRLFAALTRPYRLGILSATTATKSSDYVTFCHTTASDAPNLVWELRLDWRGFYNTELFLLLLESVRSLSLKNDAWRNLLFPGTLRTSHIHTLSLCQEFFPDMAKMEAFFRSMPNLRTLLLKYEVYLWTSFDAQSVVAINEGPAISELHLTDVRDSGKLMDHRLHIHRLDHELSPGDMEELVITRPKPSFGYLEDDGLEEEDGEEETKTEDGDEDEGNVEPAEDGNHALAPLDLAGAVQGLQKVTTSQPASFPPGLRLQLLQFDLISDDDADGGMSDSMSESDHEDPTSTRLLRWLTYCFFQIRTPPSIRTVEINISAKVGEINDFINARLWKKWDAELARFGDGPPDVNITVKSIICKEEAEEEGEDRVPFIVTIREEALEKLRQCIEHNMVHVRKARRLRISTTVCRAR